MQMHAEITQQDLKLYSLSTQELEKNNDNIEPKLTPSVKALPCLSDIIGSPLHPIQNLFIGFHAVGTILGFSDSYCNTLLRGHINEPTSTSVPIISKTKSTSNKPMLDYISLNITKPTISNLFLSGGTRCSMLWINTQPCYGFCKRAIQKRNF